MSEKQTILIIEDERAISNFISRALTANDYRAIPAYTGKEGLSLFFSHGPDLVLLDLNLPGESGFDICIRIRASSEVPIIFVTRRELEARITAMKLEYADSLEHAFARAREIKGEDASVTVIPDGVSIVIENQFKDGL